MTHLPECNYTPEYFVPEDNILWRGEPCICDALRACEQRVTEQWESLRGWGESYAYKTGFTRGKDNGFDAGYAAGLDAAEAAINKAPRTTNLMITLQDALADIRALRAEK